MILHTFGVQVVLLNGFWSRIESGAGVYALCPHQLRVPKPKHAQSFQKPLIKEYKLTIPRTSTGFKGYSLNKGFWKPWVPPIDKFTVAELANTGTCRQAGDVGFKRSGILRLQELSWGKSKKTCNNKTRPSYLQDVQECRPVTEGHGTTLDVSLANGLWCSLKVS